MTASLELPDTHVHFFHLTTTTFLHESALCHYTARRKNSDNDTVTPALSPIDRWCSTSFVFYSTKDGPSVGRGG